MSFSKLVLDEIWRISTNGLLIYANTIHSYENEIVKKMLSPKRVAEIIMQSFIIRLVDCTRTIVVLILELREHFCRESLKMSFSTVKLASL